MMCKYMKVSKYLKPVLKELQYKCFRDFCFCPDAVKVDEGLFVAFTWCFVRLFLFEI